MGNSLSPEEFQRCLKQAKFLTPKVGKFWQGSNVEPGIYIVVAGKVRLLDSAGELIVTLEAGASFGEFTLFGEAEFQPYAARASMNLQVCFIPGEVLLPLMAHPRIREHLWNEAQSRNSLLMRSPLERLPLGASPELHDTKTSSDHLKIYPKKDIYSIPAVEAKPQKKTLKAYFPKPTQRVGHLWQRVMQRYPFFAQQSASDCGAACLVMVSSYWGKRFSINRSTLR